MEAALRHSVRTHRIALPQAQAVALPDGVDFVVGACLGIPALTAVQAIRLAAPLEGRTVLVTGAHELINYKTEDVAQRVRDLTQGRGADVIVDMDFSSTAKLLEQGALRPHGQLVGYGSNNPGEISVNFRSLLWGSLGLKFFLVYDLGTEDRRLCIATLTGLLEANGLRHQVGQTFPLSDIVAAHEAVESGQVVGNVVLTLE